LDVAVAVAVDAVVIGGLEMASGIGLPPASWWLNADANGETGGGERQPGTPWSIFQD